MNVFYFGCRNKANLGHFMYRPDGWQLSREKMPGPWKLGELDGGLAPKKTTEQGAALMHKKPGWIYISFWDYTADSRGKSNSGFLFQVAPGEINDFDELMQEAENQFPWIFHRFDAAHLKINLIAEPAVK